MLFRLSRAGRVGGGSGRAGASATIASGSHGCRIRDVKREGPPPQPCRLGRGQRAIHVPDRKLCPGLRQTFRNRKSDALRASRYHGHAPRNGMTAR